MVNTVTAMFSDSSDRELAVRRSAAGAVFGGVGVELGPVTELLDDAHAESTHAAMPGISHFISHLNR